MTTTTTTTINNNNSKHANANHKHKVSTPPGRLEEWSGPRTLRGLLAAAGT